MEDAWYYVDATQSAAGPHSREALEALYASGRIKDNTLIWNSSMAAWTPYGKSGLLAVLIPTIPPPIPFESRTESAAQIVTSSADTVPYSISNSSRDDNLIEPSLDLDALVSRPSDPKIDDSTQNNVAIHEVHPRPPRSTSK